ncbi:MAG: excinuclease ABC subunit C, partial [Clostridia bacterium]|nr:excinuclease ABC subunit C [Clostridia bacterium]
KLLQRIRDESHRFAITFHRQLRNKNTLKSKLDEIDGVGKNKAMALNQKFKSVKNISNASIEELKQVDGIGDKLAKTIYDYFHQGE